MVEISYILNGRTSIKYTTLKSRIFAALRGATRYANKGILVSSFTIKTI